MKAFGPTGVEVKHTYPISELYREIRHTLLLHLSPELCGSCDTSLHSLSISMQTDAIGLNSLGTEQLS